MKTTSVEVLETLRQNGIQYHLIKEPSVLISIDLNNGKSMYVQPYITSKYDDGSIEIIPVSYDEEIEFFRVLNNFGDNVDAYSIEELVQCLKTFQEIWNK